MKSKQMNFVRSCAIVLSLLLAACGGGVVKQDDASVLQKRTAERWNYLIAHHAEKAYDFLTPGYRATKTRQDYASEMNNRPVHWQSVDFIDQKCDEPDACTVQLRTTFTVAMTARIGHDVKAVTIIWERWIRVKGTWYYLPESKAAVVAKPAAH